MSQTVMAGLVESLSVRAGGEAFVTVRISKFTQVRIVLKPPLDSGIARFKG
jgi:hypothetical protein